MLFSSCHLLQYGGCSRDPECQVWCKWWCWIVDQGILRWTVRVSDPWSLFCSVGSNSDTGIVLHLISWRNGSVLLAERWIHRSILIFHLRQDILCKSSFFSSFRGRRGSYRSIFPFSNGVWWSWVRWGGDVIGAFSVNAMKKFVVFSWNGWIGTESGGFFDLVDHCLVYFPSVCFAHLPVFLFCCFLVVLLSGLFFGYQVGSWRAR